SAGASKHVTASAEVAAVGAPATSTPLRRLPANWTPPTFEIAAELPRLPIGHQSLEPPEFSWVGETGRHIGTVVHAALESFASAPELPKSDRIRSSRDGYRHQLLRH